MMYSVEQIADMLETAPRKEKPGGKKCIEISDALAKAMAAALRVKPSPPNSFPLEQRGRES